VTDYDVTTVDLDQSSHWVSENAAPDYADGYAYTIQFVVVDDTSVELIPNVTIVKVVDGYHQGGTVGNRYLYVGTGAKVVLSEQDYRTSQWQDVTQNPAYPDFTYLSSFQNYTYTVIGPTVTGGGWLRYKTVTTKTIQTFGLKDYYTHTLQADYPVRVSFLPGAASPSIAIHAAQGIYLQDSITTPSNGTVSLSSNGDLIFGDAAAILGASPVMSVGGSVRANVEGGNSAALTITAEGDIDIRAVFDLDGNQSSTMVVGQVLSTGGNVTLHAPGGIQAQDEDSVIGGNRIELRTDQGGIGSDDRPLRIDSDQLGSGGVAAKAHGDIYLREIDGDLKLVEPQSWENALASIHSESGNVSLEVPSGSILDAFYEEFQPRTQQEIDALDQKMALTGDAARQAAEMALRSEQGLQTQLYHDYWRDCRGAEPTWKTCSATS
jgi:hypothetical protein